MSFGNPIVGSSGALIREVVKSSDYVPGVSGWAIMKDGTAEFNGVTINGGELLIRDPDGSYIRIYDQDPGSGAVIEYHPADVSGDTILPAKIAGISAVGSASLDIDGPNVNGTAGGYISLAANDTATKETVIIGAETFLASEILIRSHHIKMVSSSGTAFESDDVAGVMTLGLASTIVSGALGTAWVKPSLNAGWTNRGTIYPDLQYRKVAGNYLQIVGEIIPGTLADGTVIFTLPVGFRPVDEQLIPCRKGAAAIATLLVSSNGQVAIFDGAGSTLIQIMATLIPLDTTT